MSTIALAATGDLGPDGTGNAPAGRFAKDQFDIDHERDTVSCPNGQSNTSRGKNGDGGAHFGQACTDCPLRAQCTTSQDGRP